MKRTVSVTILLIIFISFIPLETQPKRISELEKPEFLTRLDSSTPFDFPQQWRKTKKDSDEWLRAKEGFNTRIQGITPLWACVYSRDDHKTENPIIRAASDGGLIVGCTHFIRSTYDFWTGIVKLSSDSSIEWQRSYRTSYEINMIKCIEQTDDGGFIVGVRSRIAEDGFLILKLSADGSIEWVHGYTGGAGDMIHSLKQTNDGGYILVGATRSFSDDYDPDFGWFLTDLLVIKLSSLGNIEWQRVFGGPDWETEWMLETRKATIIESSHRGYLVVCDTRSFSADNRWPDLWVVKLSDLGEIEWQRVFGGKESERLLYPDSHATETTDGKYIIACHTWSYGVVNPDTNSRFSEIWVLKLKPNGDVEWQKTYGEKGSDTAHVVQATSNGGCIIAGASNSWSGSDNPDFWVFKISPTGNIIWQHTYGGEFWDKATSVCITNDNGLAIAGITKSFDNKEYDLLVFKVTSDGKLDTMCSSLVGDSNAVVMDTDCIPLDTYEVARVTNAIKTTPSITTKVINVKKNLICWNLNHPPVNVSFERAENKSFFASETWHTISWTPSSYNSDNNFAIAEYKIYRKEREDANDDYSSYQHLATVPGNTYIFVDDKVQSNEQYLYAVASVDSEGNESPRSDAVGNVS